MWFPNSDVMKDSLKKKKNEDRNIRECINYITMEKQALLWKCCFDDCLRDVTCAERKNKLSVHFPLHRWKTLSKKKKMKTEIYVNASIIFPFFFFFFFYMYLIHNVHHLNDSVFIITGICQM